MIIRPRSQMRLVARTLVALAAVAAGAGLVQLAWHGRLFAGRAGFPLDLEWMEGGMLVHAQRLADGQALYVAPSLDFIPFLYTPLYPAVVALLSKVVPLGYVLGRVVSLVAFASALALVGYAVAREVRGRGPLATSLAVLLGAAAAGAVASGFEFTGAFYDLARSDSLLLALEAAALLLAFHGRTSSSAALAGVLIALAFFTKQTASLLGVGIGLGLMVASWRRGLVYGAAAAVSLAVGLTYLVAASNGWFWTYIFKLHQSHPFRYDTLKLTPVELWRFEWAVLLALALATVGLALGRRLRRSDAVLAGAALAGIASGIVGFATMWAWQNAYIPSLYFPVLAAAVLGARLCAHAAATGRAGAAVLAALVALGLGAQNLRAGKPNLARRLPQPADHAAAGRFLDKLRGLPGRGFIPFHPYYAVIAGKRPYVHRMGVMDVGGALGRPLGLDEAMRDQRFPFVILDWKSQPYEWPHLEARYRLVYEFRDGIDTVRNFSGADTWPRYLCLPMKEAPPLPPGGGLVADFETGRWDGWTPDGPAFGHAPGYAPAQLYGRYAADSGRSGPGDVGTLRSPVLRVDKARLRLSLLGPADDGLRVLLVVNGQDPVRRAEPTGGMTTIEWDVAGLMGRDAVIVIEDRSTTAALVVDEIVAYQ